MNKTNLAMLGIAATSYADFAQPISQQQAAKLETLYAKTTATFSSSPAVLTGKGGATLQSLKDPGSNAYFFEILDDAGTTFEAYFELKLITDFYAWQIWYKRKGTDDEYARLSTSNHSGGSGAFQISLGNEEEINRLFAQPFAQDIEMNRVTLGYTDVIQQTFGKPNAGPGERPKAAFDAFNWLIKNRVKYENGELKTKFN